MKCRAKETCKVEKGEAACVHDYMGTCTGSQSLQYHTFDGMTVDIRGGCTYTIAKYCGNDPALVPFTVEEKKSESDFEERLTNIYVYTYNVSIHKGEGGKIQVGFSRLPQGYSGQSQVEEEKTLWQVRLKLKKMRRNHQNHRVWGDIAGHGRGKGVLGLT